MVVSLSDPKKGETHSTSVQLACVYFKIYPQLRPSPDPAPSHFNTLVTSAATGTGLCALLEVVMIFRICEWGLECIPSIRQSGVSLVVTLTITSPRHRQSR